MFTCISPAPLTKSLSDSALAMMVATTMNQASPMESAKLTSKDVECIVHSLNSFTVSEVGSTGFLAMAYNMQRLSLHMHTEGNVVASVLLLHNKITVLVQNLLAIEAWRVFVLRDKLLPRVAAKNRARISFVLHTERTLLALIDLVLLQDFDLTDDISIALIDYCARSMTWILDARMMHALPVDEHELEKACRDSEYQCAVLAATSLARHFCESFEKLCLDAHTRILDTHDFPLLLVQLLEEPPWTRRRRVDNHVVWEKWVDDAWKVVPTQNLIQLTQNEGQCWISLFYLTCSDACRQRYGLTAPRKKQLLRLKKLLDHGILVSQLGILMDIKQYLVALERLEVRSQQSGGLIERVDVLRDLVVHSKDWSSIATEQYERIFSKVQDSTDHDIQKFASLYMNDDFLLTKPKEFTHPSGHIEIETQSGDRLVTFHLSVKVEEKEKFMDTPEGEFLRSTLAVHCIDGEEEHLLIHPESKVRATITASGTDRLLQVDNLALPTIKEVESDIGSSITTPKEISSSREWRQLGAVEDGLVLQLGFKRSPRSVVGEDHDVCCYFLDTKAFIAQRH